MSTDQANLAVIQKKELTPGKYSLSWTQKCEILDGQLRLLGKSKLHYDSKRSVHFQKLIRVIGIRIPSTEEESWEEQSMVRVPVRSAGFGNSILILKRLWA